MSESMRYLNSNLPPDGTLSDGCITEHVTRHIQPLHISDDPDWSTQSYGAYEEELKDVFHFSGNGGSLPQLNRAVSDYTSLKTKAATTKPRARPAHRLRHRMSMVGAQLTKLPNSLIEMCVLVGLDQDTGVRCARHAQVFRLTNLKIVFSFA